jgi:hypothetical protein
MGRWYGSGFGLSSLPVPTRLPTRAAASAPDQGTGEVGPSIGQRAASSLVGNLGTGHRTRRRRGCSFFTRKGCPTGRSAAISG